MPRMTAKYRSALNVAQLQLGLRGNLNDQEALYAELQDAGFFWNSKQKVWEEHAVEDADEPTKLIMIRVWADAEIVEEAADEIVAASQPQMMLVERSNVYLCRPPKQLEGRVYLKFMPKGGAR